MGGHRGIKSLSQSTATKGTVRNIRNPINPAAEIAETAENSLIMNHAAYFAKQGNVPGFSNNVAPPVRLTIALSGAAFSHPLERIVSWCHDSAIHHQDES